MSSLKIMLNDRQFSFLTCVLMAAGGLVSLPKALIGASEQDAWMTELGGALYGLVICAFFSYLSRRFPQKNLFEIAHIVAGRWGGSLINLLCLVYLWMINVRATRGFADFLNSTLLERTPEEISIYIFTIVLIYYGASSIEVTARVADFIIPVFLLFMWSLPLILANEFSLVR
ncbi:MAG: GerAB/ArcD/ProY family transporter, partial [Tumebacillaceae bacterium]